MVQRLKDKPIKELNTRVQEGNRKFRQSRKALKLGASLMPVALPIYLIGTYTGRAEGRVDNRQPTVQTTISPFLLLQLKALWKQGADAKHRGDFEGARRAWQRALQIAPGHPGFQEAIDKLPRSTAATGNFTPAPSLSQSPAIMGALPSSQGARPSQGSRHEEVLGYRLRISSQELPAGAVSPPRPLPGVAPSSNESSIVASPPVVSPDTTLPNTTRTAKLAEPRTEIGAVPSRGGASTGGTSTRGGNPPLVEITSGWIEGRPPEGHLRSLAVARTSTSPVIDGKIDEEVWQSALGSTGFWMSTYNRPPQEQTEVRVLADDKALYFAFICHDAQPDKIHAEQTRRGANLSLDDHVIVQIDPYHNHRTVSDFLVNAQGTQTDAIAGGRARNIAWRGDWQAATQRVPRGWTAEIAIPFAILNFQKGTETFGINFARYNHRTEEWSEWANLTVRSLREEMGHLTNLPLAQSQRADRLTIMPYTALGLNAPDKRGDTQDRSAAGGLDLRYAVTNNLSSVLSINPDFSQVEEDVLGLSFNYNEKLLADNRPFFQEGSGFFGSTDYFHSGRVPNFDVGLKTFGRMGPFQLGVLGAQSPDGRRDYVARVLRELGPALSVALTSVGTERDDFSNRLLALQAGGRFGRSLSLNTDLATTATDGRDGDGTRAGVSLNYSGTHWSVGTAFDHIAEDFFPANGFIAGDVLGTRGGSLYTSYYRDFAEGHLRSINGSLTYGWRDTLSGLLQRRNTSFYVGGETRSNISFNLGTTVGPYRPRGANPGEWADTLNDDRFYTASLFFDTRNDRRGYGLTYSWGNLGGGKYSDLSPSFWLKPTGNTYLSYSHQQVNYFGINTQGILGLSWDITPEQSLSARLIRIGGDFGGSYYRLAYRRQVQRGVDVFAVYNAEPFTRDRFTVKLVRAFGVY
jgi:Domain of unknown function (DUF5916)/Carbohydrate family 9 binding domain-like